MRSRFTNEMAASVKNITDGLAWHDDRPSFSSTLIRSLARFQTLRRAAQPQFKVAAKGVVPRGMAQRRCQKRRISADGYVHEHRKQLEWESNTQLDIVVCQEVRSSANRFVPVDVTNFCSIIALVQLDAPLLDRCVLAKINTSRSGVLTCQQSNQSKVQWAGRHRIRQRARPSDSARPVD